MFVVMFKRLSRSRRDMAAPISRHHSARSRPGCSAADLSRVGFDATSEVYDVC
jgi:hypothetical protein